MPITIRRDIKRKYNLGTSFSLRQDIPGHMPGSFVNRIKGAITMQNLEDFILPLNGFHLEREVIKSLGRKFNLKAKDEDVLNELWKIWSDAMGFQKNTKEDAQDDLDKAYEYLARIADGDYINKPTFSRVQDRSDEKFVIFSDLHMTAFGNTSSSLPNYFKDSNLDLYLEVLNYYAKDGEFCLVENGDVEECIIFAPTFHQAKQWNDLAPNGKKKFPITNSDQRWEEFLQVRYGQRMRNLSQIIESFSDYYDLIRRKFVARNKYVRLTGNHDTYLDQPYERDLLAVIERELETKVYDVLRISQNDNFSHLVLHGHQFDASTQQHGDIPFAKSIGEVYSECGSWAYEGPDRFWKKKDSKNWYIGNRYGNILAKDDPNSAMEFGLDLLESMFNFQSNSEIDSKNLIETLLGHEVAWDYFENTDGIEALALEVWTGDELYKLRHTDEVSLCQRYLTHYLRNQDQIDISLEPPKIIIGHTHEPRQNAVFPGTINLDKAPYFLNTGSAGRYANLIWCVEIDGDEERICSWSKVDGKLKKIPWRSEEYFLLHDQEHIEWID